MVVLIEQTKQNSARAVFHYDSMHKFNENCKSIYKYHNLTTKQLPYNWQNEKNAG